MFSQLGPLFKTSLRQAESADARLEIRRDEKQDQGKKQDFGNEQDDTSALWEDSTTVSVEALRAFLTEFLKGRGDDVPNASMPVPDDTDPMALTPEYRAPANSTAARAVKAYAATAGSSHPAVPEAQQQETAQENVDLVNLLKADELRTIHVLIAELDALARKGTQFLTIEKADTFLESLVAAVNLEKTRA